MRIYSSVCLFKICFIFVFNRFDLSFLFLQLENKYNISADQMRHFYKRCKKGYVKYFYIFIEIFIRNFLFNIYIQEKILCYIL